MRETMKSIEPLLKECKIGVLQCREIPSAVALWRKTEGVGLSAEETDEMLSAFLDRNPGISSSALAGDGSLVGALLGGHDGRRGYLYHLAVEDSYRDLGLGRLLVRRTTAELARLGIAKAAIMVYSGNAQGRAFWEHLGWTVRPDLDLMQIKI